MKTSEQIDKVSAALVAAQKEMGNAVKDSNNPFFKSKYADLLAIREVILPVVSKHDLSVLQLPATLDGKNYIETVVLHVSGQYLSSMDEVVVSKQNDPQSKLAAQTYTRRGSLQAFFNIGCEDDDGNTASDRDVSKPADAPKPSAFNRAPAKPAEAPKPAETPKQEEAPKLEPTPAAPRRGSFGKS